MHCRSILLVSLLIPCAISLVGCGGDSHEQIVGDLLDLMDEEAEIIAAVTDEASAEDAVTTIASNENTLRELLKRAESLGAPDSEQKERLIEIYEKQALALFQRLNRARLGFADEPKLWTPIEEAMGNRGSLMMQVGDLTGDVLGEAVQRHLGEGLSMLGEEEDAVAAANRELDLALQRMQEASATDKNNAISEGGDSDNGKSGALSRTDAQISIPELALSNGVLDVTELNRRIDSGDAYAMAILGESYLRGEWGVEKDTAKALELLSAAAESGHPLGLLGLGTIYGRGEGVEANEDRADEYYKQAYAELAANVPDSDPRWKCNLAMYYWSGGRGVDKNPSKAAILFGEAATSGYPRAVYWFGVLYQQGFGVTKDLDKAIELYTQAADGNYPRAIFRLGTLHALGIGVTEDHEKALRYLFRAEELGDAEAYLFIANIYYEQEEDTKAFEYYLKAAESGIAQGMTFTGQAYEKGQGVDRDLIEAVNWYAKAVELGEVEAMMHLGVLYANGTGVDQDFEKAESLISKAVEGGLPEATEVLEQLQVAMNGVEPLEGAEEAQTPTEGSAKADGNIVIKGFWIGMDIDDAAELVNEKYTEQLGGRHRVVDGKLQPETPQFLSGGILCMADDDGKVYHVEFNPIATDTMFKSGDMSITDFIEALMDAYEIPSMEPYFTRDLVAPESGWEFIDQQGGVRIWIRKPEQALMTHPKAFAMRRYATKEQRGFD